MHNICDRLDVSDPHIRFRPKYRIGIQAYISPLRRCSQSIQSKYDSSFAVVGPILWNVLPSSLQAMQRFDTVKNQLTKFVSSLPDEPTVSGQPRAHGNSLLDLNKTNKQHLLRIDMKNYKIA